MAAILHSLIGGNATVVKRCDGTCAVAFVQHFRNFDALGLRQVVADQGAHPFVWPGVALLRRGDCCGCVPLR